MVEKKTSSPQKNTGMAVIAYFLFFVPLLTDQKDDPFVKFHTKQGLLLFISFIVSTIAGVIPVIGWIIALVAPLFLFVLMIIGILNAMSGKQEPLPVIGKYAEEWFKF